jgi:uncharacterized protein YcnI
LKRYAIMTVITALLVLPAAASAHISLHPNTVPAGSNPTWEVRVPSEEEGANTVKVDMQVPPGFTDASTEIPLGWTAKVLHTKLATPIQTDSGPVTEEVSEIIWSAKGPGIPSGSFQSFPILAAVPDNAAGHTLTFKVIQTYSNGKVVRWIEAPSSEQHPAPTVNVTAKGGVLQDVAGTEAGPGAVPTGNTSTTAAPASKSESSKGASKGLAIAALIVGALGLLIGLLALAAARRRGAVRT